MSNDPHSDPVRDDPTRQLAAGALEARRDPSEDSSQVDGAAADTPTATRGAIAASQEDDPWATCVESPLVQGADDAFAFEIDDPAGCALPPGHATERMEDRYEIQVSLGTGGMGEVWRAVDRRLRRPVAIKRMKGELADNRQASARFLREARAVAALNHFHIVQVFDFGCDRDGYFIVMEYVEGENLATLVRRTGPLPPVKAIEVALQICQALGLAHARGVVHRDVKPANILWTTTGAPKLTDFGLARLEQIGGEETQTGMVLGTLDYMAPEQRMDPRGADARSDLWSLAATLYQLITGSPPRVIRLEGVPEAVRPMLLKALSEAPQDRYATAEAFSEALRSVQAKLEQPAASTPPADTLGRCLKCQASNDPTRKFCQRCGESLREPCPRCRQPIVVGAVFCGECGANVDAVVGELRLEYDGEKLRIESLLSEFRHPEAIVKLEVLAFGNGIRLGEYTAWAASTLEAVRIEYQRLREQRRELTAAAQQRCAAHEYQAAVRLLEQIPARFRDEQAGAIYAHACDKQQRLQTLADEIRQAQQAKRLEGLVARVEQFIELKPSDPNASELLARLYTRQCVEVRRFEGGYAAATTCLALFRDGRRLLVGGADGMLRLADLQTGREVRRFTGHEGNVRSVAIAPDETTFLSAGHDGVLRVWDVSNGRELRSCRGHTSAVACAAFSFDGRFALSGGADHMLRVWDVATGRELRRCEGHQSTVVCVAPMRDVPCALSGGADGTLRLWNVRTGKQIQAFAGHEAPVLAVAISSDGRYALTGSGGDARIVDGHLRLWDIQTGCQVRVLAGAPQTRAVAITPDGRYALSGGRDSSLRLWRMPAGRELHQYAGHASEILAVAVSPNGRFAVSAGSDHSVRVWRLPQ